jgi:AcrR family transcriptional regulator
MNDTRDYIIDQAYRLFLSKSYEAVTISDISKSIGFTKGALYHHFLNKEELFKAVIDKYLRIFGLGDLKENITLVEYIQVTIEHIKQIVYSICVDDRPFVPVDYLSLVIDAFRHYPSFTDNTERLFNTEIEKIKFVLDQAIKSKEIRSDINTSVMAVNFFAISIGIIVNFFKKNLSESAFETFQSQMNEFYKILKV